LIILGIMIEEISMPRVELHAKNRSVAALAGRAADFVHTVEAQVPEPQPAPPQPSVGARTSSETSKGAEDYSAFVGSLGTKNPEFVDGLVAQLLGVSARDGGELYTRELTFALTVIKGSQPKDEFDAMLVAQMAVVHGAVMRLSGEVAHAEYQLNRDSAIRAVNQLARTFCAQLDALSRYRTKAENISVQNVAIAQAGGGAISETRSPAFNSKADSGIARAILGRPGPAI
jgi:hypothetical protein